MNFSKVTLLLLILALTYLAVVESRSNRRGKGHGRYKLFRSRLNRRLPDEGRQYRDTYNNNNRDKPEYDDYKKESNKVEDDYEDIDDDLDNLDLDDANRIFFFNKGGTTTEAPVTTTTTDPVPPPVPPTPPTPPPPDATPPVGPPTPPVSRSYERPNRYKYFDF